MGNKYKGGKARNVQTLESDVPIEDDPYWKVSTLSANEERLGRYIKRFMQFEKRHKSWVEDIMGGFPTYYCILGVNRGATVHEITQAFDRKIESSCYPDELIIGAFEVLRNPGLQKAYDEFLFLFEQISKIFPLNEKNELIKAHSENIETGKKFVKLEKIKEVNETYVLLFLEGMPDIYEVAGLKKDLDIEKIKEECPRDSGLLRQIYLILTDPQSRETYDKMMNLINENLKQEGILNRKRRKELWDHLSRDVFDKIILIALTEPDTINKTYVRGGKILNINEDWKQYLPPSKETFFSILKLDADSVSTDKKELETTLRDKYREIERTPTVNLAYSVLKNKSLRDDYLWIIENLELIEVLEALLTDENDCKYLKNNFIQS